MTISLSKFWSEIDEGSNSSTPTVVNKVSTGKVLTILSQDKVLHNLARSQSMVDMDNIVIVINLMVQAARLGDSSKVQVSANTWMFGDETNPVLTRSRVNLDLDWRFPTMGGHSFF
ncbi:hypothetical protein PM082_004152 [Marasmius tenuissimus]|nr:hypothetical protein PM082_004152 [Marasmius tenuissimus]